MLHCRKKKWRKAKTKSRETSEAAFGNPGKGGGDLRQGGNDERVGRGSLREGLANGLTGYEI